MGVNQLKFSAFILDNHTGSWSTCWIISVYTYTRQICNRCRARTDSSCSSRQFVATGADNVYELTIKLRNMSPGK